MASGILGILLLAGYTATVRTFGGVKDTMTSVVSDELADLSLRGFESQLRHSHLDRADLFNCSSMTLLRRTEAIQHRTASLIKAGDSLSFAYTERNLIGATHLTKTHSIKVADTSPFQKDDLVYLKSLNSQSLGGLFSIANINVNDSSLELQVPASSYPPDFPCAVNPEAVGSFSIFDPLKPLKFGVELIRVASYSVEASKNESAGLSLFLRKWPLRGGVYGPFLVLEDVQKVQIDQEFHPSSENKGEFKVSVSTEYGGAQRKSRRSIASGYAITGLDITNQRAVPQPPMLDDLYVTCSFRSTLLMDEFVVGTSTDRIPVYRIEPSYTEAETLSGSRAPTITASIIPYGIHDPRFSTQCWDEDEVTVSENSTSSLPTKSSMSTMTFHLNKEGTAFKPIFCLVPDASQLKGNLTYMSITQREVRQRVVNCTPVVLEGTPGHVWKYDEGGRTTCYRESGVISIGRLVDSKDEDRAGPSLYTTSESCTWSGSKLKTCDTSVILADNPGAKLISVDLLPSWVRIEGMAQPLKVTCE